MDKLWRLFVGKQLCVVGLDPGVTTGIAVLQGNTEVKYSSDGSDGKPRWHALLSQMTIEELQKMGEEIAEPAWRSEVRGQGSELAWWNSCSQAGAGLAMVVLNALSVGMGGLDNATSGKGDVQGLVVMEDFLLRPNEQGIGGRSIVVPVAIGAAFMAIWQQCSNVQVMISGATNKSLMGDDKIKRWFPTGGGKSGTAWVGSGKKHGTDALRHALLGVRKVRG